MVKQNKFLTDIHSCEMIEPEDEKKLFVSIRSGCLRSRDRVFTSHLRLVSSMARRYASFGADFDDLMQVGSIGVLTAISRFDPEHGVRFSQYAIPFIRGEMLYHIPSTSTIIGCSTSKKIRKMFFSLRKYLRVGENLTTREIDALSEQYGVDPSEIQMMECLLKSSFHDINGDDREYWESFLVDDFDVTELVANEEEQRIFKNRIEEFENELDERSLFIFNNRIIGDEQTPLREISERYSVSIARINQIEVQLKARVYEKFQDLM